MFKMNEELKTKIFRNKGLFFLILLVLGLFTSSIFASQVIQVHKKEKVLAATSKTISQAIRTPTDIVVPTKASNINIDSSESNTKISQSSVVPTIDCIGPDGKHLYMTQDSCNKFNNAWATPTPTGTPASNSSVSSEQGAASPTPTNIPTLTPTPAPDETPSPTSTPTGLRIQIGIDYAGQKTADSYTISVNSGQTAWDAVVAAIGISNLQYKDYGKDMGIFISGFNGINATGNQYFEFRVNGVSSNVGVSSYKCNDGDKLDFILTTS